MLLHLAGLVSPVNLLTFCTLKKCVLGEGIGRSIPPPWGSCLAFNVPLIERGSPVAAGVVFLGKQRR